MIELEVFYQDQIYDTEEYKEVYQIASQLLNILNQDSIIKKINEVNQPGVRSTVIQNVFKREVENLGFNSEKEGLFSGYKTSGLRPDYYKKLDSTGILFEVERGRICDNNMDILDLWKCHICKEAEYLFLLVPLELKQNNGEKVRHTFVTVCNRLKTFFQEGNYVNVKAVFIFGY